MYYIDGRAFGCLWDAQTYLNRKAVQEPPTVLRMPVPLTPEQAYWHACTGTPFEQQYAPVVYDRDAPTHMFTVNEEATSRLYDPEWYKHVPYLEEVEEGPHDGKFLLKKRIV